MARVTSRTDVKRFGSFAEYVSYVSAPNPNGSGALARNGSSHAPGARFRGTETWGQAVTLASSGWLDGTRRVSELAARLAGRVTSKVPRPVPAYSATEVGMLDPARYAMGRPDCLIVFADSETETETAGRGVVRVRFNESVSGSVSTEAMFVRGAACIILCDWLETGGYRVELQLVTASVARINSPVIDAYTSVMLKAAEDPLDMDKLAFVLCNGATLRRFGFRRFEMAPTEVQDKLSFGYGCPAGVDPEEGTIDLPHNLGEAGPDQALAWVCRELVRQGITVEKD